MRFSGIFQKGPEGGYSAICPELDVASQGETIEEAEANLKEAIELYLESAKDLGILNEILEEAGIDVKSKQNSVVTFTSPIEARMPA